MEQVMMSPLKWGTITLMYGQFSLATGLSSLLAYIQQQESQTYSYIENCWGLWLYTVTISHFGERFRGGQYTLVSFLFAPRCSTWPAICTNGGTPPCPVVPDPLSGARPLGDGVGSGYLKDGSPSVWSRGKALVWGPAPCSHLYLYKWEHVPPCLVGDTVTPGFHVHVSVPFSRCRFKST